MTRVVEAAHLLLPGGWVSPGQVVADDEGIVVSAGPAATERPDQVLDGFVVPGIANAHSHVHHRGLVGHADRLEAGSAATLWTWRTVMYRHLLGLSPDDLEAYATLAYMEMLRRGYTSVGEFHYIHHDPSGARYARPAEMSERIAAAAATAGIALTILPTFYAAGGLGRPPEPEQRRFTTGLDEYLSLVASLDEIAAERPTMRVGIAPHSLRAVPPDELAALLEARPTDQVHIHVAERTEEVEEVLAGLGARPVEWLLANAGVDERWCVIHATHMTDAERRGLASSGAVAGVCPLTEANLGDGRFALAPYRHEGGRLAVGTDANHLIDLPGELRMLEYGQRLASHRREAALAAGETSVGALLHRLAGAGGAQALDQPTGAIEPGARCDLVELDPNHPALVGQTPETALDAWIFSSASEAIVRSVLVGGHAVIQEGQHPHEPEALRRVAEVMRERHARDRTRRNPQRGESPGRSTTAPRAEAIVIGAGVIGLSTAVCLAEGGRRVEVRTELEPAETTSSAAAATIGPAIASPDSRLGRWERKSLAHFRSLAGGGHTGVMIRRGRVAARERLAAVPAGDVVECRPDELPPGFTVGYRVTVPVVDMVAYLEYLSARFAAAGGRVERCRVTSLRELGEEVPLIVNCAGLGARDLAGDDSVVPVRGQHVIVENPGVEEYFAESVDAGEFTAYWPHAGHVVLGGVWAPGDASTEPDVDLAKRIVERCVALEPRLREAAVLGHRVGLRPWRPNPRLHVERIGDARCVHSYGHGGAGVTYSWGVALEAAESLVA